VPFLRPLTQTAPEYDSKAPWPIDGLAYVIAFMGPFCGALAAGILTRTWIGALVGLTVGATITLANAWVSDTFIDRLIARHDVTLNRRMPRLFINILAFSWAIALCTIAMFGTWSLVL
jgi:hypothetical protein